MNKKIQTNGIQISYDADFYYLNDKKGQWRAKRDDVKERFRIAQLYFEHKVPEIFIMHVIYNREF